MITCRQLTDFLIDYFEGQLPEEEHRRFQEHLDACGDCADYLHSYRQTVELTRDLCGDSEQLPPEVPDDLVTAILEAQRGGGSQSS